MDSAVQVNGAGPPLTATDAESGRATRRYCCSGGREAVAEKVGGATAPALSPIATVWPLRTGSSLTVPAIGAVTAE